MCVCECTYLSVCEKERVIIDQDFAINIELINMYKACVKWRIRFLYGACCYRGHLYFFWVGPSQITFIGLCSVFNTGLMLSTMSEVISSFSSNYWAGSLLLNFGKIYCFELNWKSMSNYIITITTTEILVGWVLSYIYLCRLFNAKSIFIQIISSIQFSTNTQSNC